MEAQHKAPIEKLVANICTNEGINNPTVNYSIDPKKKGFVASIVNIEILGRNKQLHLIAKCIPTDEAFSENIRARKQFLQEIKFYMEVMPLYATLQQRYGAKEPFASIAKCYGYNDAPSSEMFILDDLSHAGYKLKDSTLPIDRLHLELVLKEYGKYHAVALAYKHHDYEGYKELITNMTNMHKILLLECKTTNIIIIACNKIMQILNQTEHGDMYGAFCKMCDDLKGIYLRCTTFDEHAVVFHGDSWCNNILFKYDKSSQLPVDVKLIDFQMIGAGSTAVDVSYLLMANSSPEDLKNVERYLEVYYSSLADHLRSLDCNPDIIYPYATFQDQWRKYSIYGLLFSVTALNFAMATVQDAPDLSKEFENCVNFVGEAATEYKKRIEAIVRYYYDNSII